MFRYSLCLGGRYDLKEQIEICRELGFCHLEITVRSDEEKLLNLNAKEFKEITIANKVFVTMVNIENSEDIFQLGYLKDVMRKCSLLGVEYINLGCLNSSPINDSFFYQAAKYSKAYNVKLCIENKFGSFSNTNENLNAFFRNSNCTDYLMVFNPLEC